MTTKQTVQWLYGHETDKLPRDALHRLAALDALDDIDLVDELDNWPTMEAWRVA